MLDVTACPCCRSERLRTFAVSPYRRDPPPASGDAGRDWANRAQREFLFTDWLPGQDEVELHELLCETCGFVCFSPRPTAGDVARKYDVLREAQIPLGHAAAPSRGDRHRARALRRRLAHHVDLPAARILDVGGGDGRLMRALAERGAACFVVDYATSQAPGVARLGDTVDDLPPGTRFDAAVLSHVVEHVADPVALLTRVGEIADVVYVEVPCEIWGGTPIAIDPVTHVNYFTESSLRYAAQVAGWCVARSRATFSIYGDRPLEIAWLVAHRDGAPAAAGDPQETLRRLAPAVTARLQRRCTRMISHAAARLLTLRSR